MQWLPDTIDALSRLYQQTGAIGFVAFVGVVGLMLILWRHFGQVIALATTFVDHDRRISARIVDELSQIKSSNAQIVDTNQKVLDRVGKLPSDIPICKAKSHEEIVDIIRAALQTKGIVLTEEEAEIVIRQRGISMKGA